MRQILQEIKAQNAKREVNKSKVRREHRISASPDEQRLHCIELKDDEMSEEDDEAKFTNSSEEDSVVSAGEKTLPKLEIPEADVRFIHYRPTMLPGEEEIFGPVDRNDATERISNEFININPEELVPPASHLTSIVEAEKSNEESVKLKPKPKLEEEKSVVSTVL